MNVEIIAAIISAAIKQGRIPADAYYLKGVKFSEKDNMWLVTYSTDKNDTKDYKLVVGSGEWEIEFRRKE